MPLPPKIIVASGFRGNAPKVVLNTAGVVAVGALTGVYGLSTVKATKVARSLRTRDLSKRIVAHSNGLRKLEVGQLQTLIGQILNRGD